MKFVMLGLLFLVAVLREDAYGQNSTPPAVEADQVLKSAISELRRTGRISEQLQGQVNQVARGSDVLRVKMAQVILSRAAPSAAELLRQHDTVRALSSVTEEVLVLPQWRDDINRIAVNIAAKFTAYRGLRLALQSEAEHVRTIFRSDSSVESEQRSWMQLYAAAKSLALSVNDQVRYSVDEHDKAKIKSLLYPGQILNQPAGRAITEGELFAGTTAARPDQKILIIRRKIETATNLLWAEVARASAQAKPPKTASIPSEYVGGGDVEKAVTTNNSIPPEYTGAIDTLKELFGTAGEGESSAEGTDQ